MPTDDDDEIIIIRRVSVKRPALTLQESSTLRDINMLNGEQPLSLFDALAAARILFRVLRRP